NPAAAGRAVGIARIERGVEAEALGTMADHVFEISHCFQHDIRRERQRGDRRPRRERAVVRTEWRATRDVSVEAAPVLLAVRILHRDFAAVARTVAGGETPAVFSVAFELARIARRVLALYQCGHAAVFEI